jgi:hypothetical protein
MAHSTRPTPSERSDALACWSAVLLLRSHPAAAVADDGLAPHLAGLLSAVSQELEADPESVPTTVRCAAVRLAAQIVRGSPIPISRRPAGASEPVEHPAHRADQAAGVPFRRSIRLGRMG